MLVAEQPSLAVCLFQCLLPCAVFCLKLTLLCLRSSPPPQHLCFLSQLCCFLSDSAVPATSLFCWAFVGLFVFFFPFNLIFLFPVLCGLWDLRSQTLDQTLAPAVEVGSPNHWTTREILNLIVFWTNLAH